MQIESMPMSPEHELGYRVFALVYQAGIANVFEVRCANYGTFGRDAERMYQGDFRSAETFAHGLLAGDPKALMFTGQCNMAGDIAHQPWSEDLNAAPFSEKFRPVFKGYKPIQQGVTA